MPDSFNTSEFLELPKWAVRAFMNRCIRHLKPLAKGFDIEVFDVAYCAQSAISAATVVMMHADDQNLDQTTDIVWDAVEDATTNGAPVALREILLRDYQLILDHARQWPHGQLPHDLFYPLHSDFPISPADESLIIDASTAISAHLIAYFRKHPKRLFSLTPRQFEELVAELFDGFGFSVELTARTKDGGKDIVAIDHSVANVKYLIECKRYAEGKKVGVHTTRALHGVVIDHGATKGILATTADFTLGARQYFDRHKWILEGRNFDGLVEWLKTYQLFREGQLLRPGSSTSH
jgi:hypothetical protein